MEYSVRLLDLNRKDVAAWAGQILRAGTVKTDEKERQRTNNDSKVSRQRTCVEGCISM